MRTIIQKYKYCKELIISNYSYYQTNNLNNNTDCFLIASIIFLIKSLLMGFYILNLTLHIKFYNVEIIKMLYYPIMSTVYLLLIFNFYKSIVNRDYKTSRGVLTWQYKCFIIALIVITSTLGYILVHNFSTSSYWGLYVYVVGFTDYLPVIRNIKKLQLLLLVFLYLVGVIVTIFFIFKYGKNKGAYSPAVILPLGLVYFKKEKNFGVSILSFLLDCIYLGTTFFFFLFFKEELPGLLSTKTNHLINLFLVDNKFFVEWYIVPFHQILDFFLIKTMGLIYLSILFFGIFFGLNSILKGQKLGKQGYYIKYLILYLLFRLLLYFIY